VAILIKNVGKRKSYVFGQNPWLEDSRTGVDSFGRDSCYRMYHKQYVRYTRNLQRPYSLRLYGKLLIPSLVT